MNEIIRLRVWLLPCCRKILSWIHDNEPAFCPYCESMLDKESETSKLVVITDEKVIIKTINEENPEIGYRIKSWTKKF